MIHRQLELHLDLPKGARRGFLKHNRPARAIAWFNYMRGVVAQAKDCPTTQSVDQTFPRGTACLEEPAFAPPDAIIHLRNTPELPRWKFRHASGLNRD